MLTHLIQLEIILPNIAKKLKQRKQVTGVKYSSEIKKNINITYKLLTPTHIYKHAYTALKLGARNSSRC